MANWLGGYRVIANHTRTTSSSSAQTSAFDASIEYVRVTTTGPVFIEFGANPTAVAATSIYMAGDESIIFKAKPFIFQNIQGNLQYNTNPLICLN